MVDQRITCDEIASRLGGGKEVRQGPNSWNTLCPVHGDSTPSLSVREKGGKILVHCHAGCAQEDVINALRDLDLWPKKVKVWVAKPHAPKGVDPPPEVTHIKLGKPTHKWLYRNRAGFAVSQICRFKMLDKHGKVVLDDTGTPKKEIIPLSWCYSDAGDLRWHWKQMPEPRCLYNEHLLDTTKSILIVEGEKSADAANKLFSDTHLAMTWPGGGKAASRANWEVLKSRDITLWPDNDVPGVKAMQTVAEILLKVGVKAVKKVENPDGLPEGWDVADSYDGDLRAILSSARPYEPVSDSLIERFNNKFALVMIGGQAVVLQENGYNLDGHSQINYLSVTGFKEYYGNKTVAVGKTQVPESNYWLKHEDRRSYDSVVFEPEKPVNGSYNMWRGFSVEADSTGDWSLLNEHILQNLALGDESLYQWIVGWFAHIIQRPGHKVGTSLSIRGKQGTGKTILGKAMGQLYRPHYALVEDPRYIIGNFNSHMATTLLLHCDESFFAGDPRNVGKLKGMVTSDSHRIELKGKDSFEVKNYMRLLITSNHDFVVPAGLEERRFAIIDAGDGRMQDRDFFNAMWRQLNAGGFGGLLHHLQTFDLSSTDVGVIPKTAALHDQKLFSMEGVARFWYERLYYGQISLRSRGPDWPKHVAIEQLYQDYIKRSEMWGERRRVDSPTFGKEMKKFWPKEKIDKRRVSIEKRDENGRQVKELVWAYILEDLSVHRDSFSRATGHIRWEDTDEVTGDLPAGPVDLGADDEDLPF